MAQLQPVSDPALLAQLNAPDTQSSSLGAPVTDPALLNQLEGGVSWSDVPGQAARNFIPSLGGVLSDIAQPIIHPIETATNLKNLAAGLLQKSGIVSGEDSIKYADAVGQYFKERYGSTEGVKRALAKDPASVMADVSVLLTGGGGAAAKLPGLIGRTGEIAGTVGRVVDPLNAVTKPLAGAIRAADVPLGALTGAGPRAVNEARAAGREGGAASEAFTSQMRGTAPIDDILNDARLAEDQMQKTAQAKYLQDMAAVGQNQTPLRFGEIDAALNRVDRMVQVVPGRESKVLAPVRDKLRDLVNEWKAGNPADYHTAAGIDGLKKTIWQEVMENIPFEQKAQRKAVGDVYDAVKNTIVAQDPKYAKAMADYENFSSQLREIRSSLTGKPGSSVDTALRKLTSVMRNNVNTNFGKRADLAAQLQAAGAPQLSNKIAGASMSSALPRGLAGLGPTMGVVPFLTGTLPLSALPGLAATSPRLVGEAQHAIGAGQRYYGRYGPQSLETLRQLGRARNINQQ